jgi:hypothetical protein
MKIINETTLEGTAKFGAEAKCANGRLKRDANITHSGEKLGVSMYYSQAQKPDVDKAVKDKKTKYRVTVNVWNGRSTLEAFPTHLMSLRNEVKAGFRFKK